MLQGLARCEEATFFFMDRLMDGDYRSKYLHSLQLSSFS